MFKTWLECVSRAFENMGMDVRDHADPDELQGMFEYGLEPSECIARVLSWVNEKAVA